MIASKQEVGDTITLKFHTIEASVTSISNLSECTDRETNALAKKLETTLEEFGKYTAESTNTMRTLDHNLQTYREDTTQILKTLVTKIQDIPSNDNFRALAIQLADFKQDQTRITNQMISQTENFNAALAHNTANQAQQDQLTERLSYLETQNDGMRMTLRKLTRVQQKVAKEHTIPARRTDITPDTPIRASRLLRNYDTETEKTMDTEHHPNPLQDMESEEAAK